jgi:hypothetical protein
MGLSPPSSMTSPAVARRGHRDRDRDRDRDERRTLRLTLIGAFAFLCEQDKIKVFNQNPARVIPALGQIR